MFNLYTLLPRPPPIDLLWSPLRLYDDPVLWWPLSFLSSTPSTPPPPNPASTPGIQRNLNWNILLYNYVNTNGLDSNWWAKCRKKHWWNKIKIFSITDRPISRFLNKGHSTFKKKKILFFKNFKLLLNGVLNDL